MRVEVHQREVPRRPQESRLAPHPADPQLIVGIVGLLVVDGRQDHVHHVDVAVDVVPVLVLLAQGVARDVDPHLGLPRVVAEIELPRIGNRRIRGILTDVLRNLVAHQVDIGIVPRSLQQIV